MQLTQESSEKIYDWVLENGIDYLTVKGIPVIDDIVFHEVGIIIEGYDSDGDYTNENLGNLKTSEIALSGVDLIDFLYGVK